MTNLHFLFSDQDVSPVQLPESADCDYASHLHLRLHSQLLARGPGQKQDRLPGNILEIGEDRREAQSLGGGGSPGDGLSLFIHIRLNHKHLFPMDTYLYLNILKSSQSV